MSLRLKLKDGQYTRKARASDFYIAPGAVEIIAWRMILYISSAAVQRMMRADLPARK